MNSDLISRSELKKAIEKYRPISTVKSTFIDGRHSMFMDCIIEIDNAPTVDLWQLRQEATENALKKAEVLYGRPQGEWIEKHCDYGVYYRCSNCHKMPPNYECDYKEGAIKTNFCPNCGADMRGGKEK